MRLKTKNRTKFCFFYITWVEGLTKSYEAKDKEQFQEAEKEQLEEYRHAFFQTVQPLSGSTLVSLKKFYVENHFSIKNIP